MKCIYQISSLKMVIRFVINIILVQKMGLKEQEYPK